MFFAVAITRSGSGLGCATEPTCQEGHDRYSYRGDSSILNEDGPGHSANDIGYASDDTSDRHERCSMRGDSNKGHDRDPVGAGDLLDLADWHNARCFSETDGWMANDFGIGAFNLGGAFVNVEYSCDL